MQIIIILYQISGLQTIIIGSKMSSIDSKFAKSLQIHTLDNIVFEKRERKSVVRPLVNAVNQTKNKKQLKNSNTKNQESSKVKKLNNKNESKPLKGVNKLKSIKKRKYLHSNYLLTTQNSTTCKHQILSNRQHSNTKINLNQQNYHSKINKSIQNSNQKMREKSISQNAQNSQNQNIGKLRSQKKSQLKKQIPLIQPKSHIIDTQIIDIRQIVNIPKKLGRPRKPVVNQNQNVETLKNQQPIDKSENTNQNNSQKSPLKSLAFGKIYDSQKKQLVEIEQTSKPRQAKLNALKKYTQKQFYPQDSFEFQREFSNKRKRISKALKPNQYLYSINRIFRKQPKLDLNPINIEVKLDKFNLSTFQQKFGTFDIIHCSLPLTMLWELPFVSNLMVKGFIFAWVEKGQTALGYHLMKRLGYDVIDQIVWVKSEESTKTVFNQCLGEDEVNLNQDNIFLNSKSVCFVGYKCPTGQKAEYRTKISNNLIFSRPKENEGLQKPEQIYEIGDLLMPGSRKLQLGGKKQKGWVSLHHNETRLRKCFLCFCEISGTLRETDLGNNSRLIINKESGQLSSVCFRCFSSSFQNRQQDNFQEESPNQIKTIKAIQIKSVSYSHQVILKDKCKLCQQSNFNESIQCSCSSQSLFYCKQCFAKDFNSHLTHFVQQIYLNQQIFLPSDHILCSHCHKNTLSSHYYQCTASGCRTKNHLFCQQCFWKSGYEILQIQKDSNESKRKRNNGLHEFKLKKINSFPAEKVQCSHSCKEQLQLPYFVCETCVGWRWCGKCDLNDENHCLDFQTNFTNVNSSEKHVLSLIS